MASSKNQGQLVIIGGAEDKEGDCKILREFLRRAGGIKARIVVMTAATLLPGEVGDNYIRVFERLGAANVQVVDTQRREDANNSNYLEAIEQATGVFFTGGEQARIVSSLKDTKLDTAIHKRFSEGIVIGGTSAGAAMMPDMMIIERRLPDKSPRRRSSNGTGNGVPSWSCNRSAFRPARSSGTLSFSTPAATGCVGIWD